ncbi:MAG TPA: aminotransferase class V-fold PLP-dependent enzyme [Bacteroidota bacterium]|nr:aminotransferase class V-fold PLP-dependent enzyme [Bacteroidota bacterium]
MPHRPPEPARDVPLRIDPEDFRKIGYECIDLIAGLLSGIASRPVTRGLKPSDARTLIGGGTFPAGPTQADVLIRDIAGKLIDHSLLNGHPRFWGYITSPAAPIGALGDLLAAAVNPNVGSFTLSPVATAVEEQSIRWIAGLIGYPEDCGGILVTGGNMANFVCFLAARRHGTPGDVRRHGIGSAGKKLRIYVSSETHTWINKAADMSGIGTEGIRWIPADAGQRMDPGELEQRIVEDRARGDLPLMIVGTAGTVSTGAIDPLRAIAAVAKKYGIWFHVDGAYGAFAASLPDAPDDLRALALADSVAVDPHKWLYTPLECGCALVRDRALLRETFHYHPSYYRFSGDPGDAPTNFFEYGPQNSRGFRALKVWLGMKQAGRDGIVRMIRDDIALAEIMHGALSSHAEIETHARGLSIVTFRYVPPGFGDGSPAREEYLNRLNSELLERIQGGGEAFVSNAVVGGKTLLRACIVNFRTTAADARALPGIVARYGREIHAAMGAGGH